MPLPGLWPGGRTAAVTGVAAVLAVAVTLAAQAVQHPPRMLDPAGLALTAAAVAVLAWSARYPAAALVIEGLLVGSYLAAGYCFGPVQACLAVAVLSAARRRDTRVAAPVAAFAVAAVGLVLYSRLGQTGRLHSPAIAAALWCISWLVVPWLAGALLRYRAVNLALRSRLVQEAVWAERMRLARDVHDVAGHGFSVIALQAGVALHTVRDDPEQTRESLQAIHTASTHALTELRTTLGVFGPDPQPGASPPLAPSSPTSSTAGQPVPIPQPQAWPGGSRVDHVPDIRQRLQALTAALRRAGLEVSLHLDPRLGSTADHSADTADADQPASLEVEVEEAIYRVVQEALTNVIRHARAAPTEVRVALDRSDIRITISDRGPGPRASASGVTDAGQPFPPRGLDGMRQRLADVGGTLTTRAPDGGGFVVTARLPRSSVPPATTSSAPATTSPVPATTTSGARA